MSGMALGLLGAAISIGAWALWFQRLQAVRVPHNRIAFTDLYNLRNPRNLAPKPGMLAPLPIPTTILVDAGGTVRWIDQAEDYQLRSHSERVLAAIEKHLPA